MQTKTIPLKAVRNAIMLAKARKTWGSGMHALRAELGTGVML